MGGLVYNGEKGERGIPMKKMVVFLLALALLFCCACKKTEIDPSEIVPPDMAEHSPLPPAGDTLPQETEEVYTGPYNPLTGLPVETDISQRRPYAIMLNNIKAALPQYGVSQADIIYEMLAEGGITRMLGVFQDVSAVGEIGSVRSARDYYLDLAQGLDAIYVHGGGSPRAYSEISARGVPAIDGISGVHGAMFYRDEARMQNAGYEHSLFTNSQLIEEYAGSYGYRMEHEPGYSCNMVFGDEVSPTDGEAGRIQVEFSSYKTGLFEYDEESSLYLISEYDAPYVDGATGEQVGVKNVLVLFCNMYMVPGDDAGRMAAELVGSGEGYFACNGRWCRITWEKAGYDSPFVYKLEDGSPLEFGRGPSYINILPIGNSVEIS